jgi:hypothetical protein
VSKPPKGFERKIKTPRDLDETTRGTQKWKTLVNDDEKFEKWYTETFGPELGEA